MGVAELILVAAKYCFVTHVILVRNIISMGITEKWDPGPSGGTLGWDPKVEPYSGILWKYPGVRLKSNQTIKPNGRESMKINCLQ